MIGLGVVLVTVAPMVVLVAWALIWPGTPAPDRGEPPDGRRRNRRAWYRLAA